VAVAIAGVGATKSFLKRPGFLTRWSDGTGLRIRCCARDLGDELVQFCNDVVKI
jgi:hypothetical protein